MAGKKTLVEVTVAQAPRAPEAKVAPDHFNAIGAVVPESKNTSSTIDAALTPLVSEARKAAPAPFAADEVRRDQSAVGTMAAPAAASAPFGGDVVKLEPFEVVAKDSATLAGPFRRADGFREPDTVNRGDRRRLA